MSAMSVSRTTDPLRFDVGIGSAGYADVIEAPGSGQAQKALLPGTTTVSQALDEIFPSDRSVDGEVMRALTDGASAMLRTPSGFNQTARDAVKMLREHGSAAAGRAAIEIENLLADGDLFEHYRMSLLET